MQSHAIYKLINSAGSYELRYDESKKTVYLFNKTSSKFELKAHFFHDTSDGAALLSNFEYLLPPQQQQEEGLVKLTADMVSDYLSIFTGNCKLFCLPENHKSELADSKDYRCSGIDRLMLRESEKTPLKTKPLPEEFKVQTLEVKSVSASDINQISTLLKQTYWAKDADESYIRNALTNSVFLVARDNSNRIIGLVRYITNNDFAYISDMVVDTKYRKQGIATLLMQKLTKLVDGPYRFTALISAREGDGKGAAPQLYGKKFGFKDYDNARCQNTIYFRYIKYSPENIARLSNTQNTEQHVAQPKSKTPQSSIWKYMEYGAWAIQFGLFAYVGHKIGHKIFTPSTSNTIKENVNTLTK